MAPFLPGVTFRARSASSAHCASLLVRASALPACGPRLDGYLRARGARASCSLERAVGGETRHSEHLAPHECLACAWSRRKVRNTRFLRAPSTGAQPRRISAVGLHSEGETTGL